MNAAELRKKLQAETECSLSHIASYVDDEVGVFLKWLFVSGQMPDGPTPNYFWSERAGLLSDEELMFRWAVFKM